eukprot:2478805-Amphidinium_carterae.2
MKRQKSSPSWEEKFSTVEGIPLCRRAALLAIHMTAYKLKLQDGHKFLRSNHYLVAAAQPYQVLDHLAMPVTLRQETHSGHSSIE